MFAVKKALCPIDFSPASDIALDAAISIVESHAAELYLLHVIEGPAHAGDHTVDSSRAETAREHVRARMAELVAGRSTALRPHLLVTDGDAAEEILRMEEIFGADLVVLAPHGRPTLGKIIFGSVAEKVARGTRASVLIVKKHLSDESLEGDGA